MYDVVIIGGGVAGMSAALWCDDLGLRALLLEKESDFGGQLHIVYNPIRNHLGIEAENGKQLLEIFSKQIAKCSIEVLRNARVSEINFEKKIVSLQDGRKFQASALIIATGVRRRELGVKGESEYRDRGILVSGKRDIEKVRDKKVCVVGGGDAALENAVILSEVCETVYLVHRRQKFKARSEFVEKVVKNPKIKIFTETVVRGIYGRDRVESVELERMTDGQVFPVLVDAVLIRIGVTPNSELCKGNLDLDESGYIKIDSNCETSVKNVFAIGDVAHPLSPTISTAVGTGATAVKIISARLNNI